VKTAERTPRKQESAPHARHGDLRQAVRQTYTDAARLAAQTGTASRVASRAPHSGLGCGSPTVFAGLSAGEWVLDLGSGAGFDCLAASVEVGSTGRVVGIDVTHEMVRLARRHATEAGVAVAHFLQGAIEHLPFPEATFDVVISNCVINLSAEKEQVLAEACRVLKPGGRLAVADIVAIAPLPARARENPMRHTSCVAGAIPLERISGILHEAGFGSEQIEIEEYSRSLMDAWAPGTGLERYVAAARVTAIKHADKKLFRQE
jgi:SAM-dependent methyltransferase